MHDSADTVTAAFDNMRQTTAQQLKMLEIRFQNILIVIGLQLLPIVNQFLGALLKVAGVIMAWVQTAVGMDQLASAIKGIAIVVGVALIPMLIHLLIVAAPLIAAVLAIVAAGILLGKAMDFVSQHMGFFRDILKQLHPVLVQIGTTIGWAWQQLQKAVASPEVQQALQQLKTAFLDILPVLKVIAQVVATTWVVAIVGAITAGILIFAALIAIISRTINILGAIIGVLMRIPGAVSEAFTSAKTHVGDFFSWLGTSVHLGLNAIGSMFTTVFHAIGDVITWFTELTPRKIGYMIGHTIGTFITWGITIRQTVIRLAGEIPQAISNMGQSVITALEHMATKAINTVIAWAVDTGKEIQKLAVSVPIAIEVMGYNTLAWFGHLKDEAVRHITEMAVQIWVELQKLQKQAELAAYQFIQGLINGIKNGVSSVVQGVKDLGAGMVNGFKNALGIKSPSSVMHAAGMNMTLGLINGFKSINVASAWAQHTSGLLAPSAGEGASSALTRGGVGIGGQTVNNTWHLNFPGVTDKDAIKAAVLELERDNYRSARRGGKYQGVRAGI